MKKSPSILSRSQITIVASLVFSAVACGDGGLNSTVPLTASEKQGTPEAGVEVARAGGGGARDNDSGTSARKPSGSVTFRFATRGRLGEDFVASTTDPVVIGKARQQLALPRTSRRLHVNGYIGRAKGKSNLKWSWQYLESRWDVVEVSFGTCNGLPSDVDANLRRWLAEVGQFCPIASYVVEELS
ncbi:MAG: hypothetical protein M3R07_06915 [Gemmatimonadota bacterium]|nr:hypothetical protein [Gemmatimonadota bacterium]